MPSAESNTTGDDLRDAHAERLRRRRRIGVKGLTPTTRTSRSTPRSRATNARRCARSVAVVIALIEQVVCERSIARGRRPARHSSRAKSPWTSGLAAVQTMTAGAANHDQYLPIWQAS